MKRLKKILKWTGIILLVLITGFSIVTASRQHLKYEAPYPAIKASSDSAVIERGRHLVISSAHCISCHSTKSIDSLSEKEKSELPLSGGYLFDVDIAKIYSKNITPDKETGIGRYTDAEVARVLRYGVHPNGEAVFEFMPFHNMSDEDLTAIISYLRSRPAVKNKVPENEFSLIGNAVKAYMIKPVGPSETIQPSVSKDTTAEYGRYLAMNVANCNGCHTQRDLAGNFTGKPFAGGSAFNEQGVKTVPPNLTPDPSGRITEWTQQMFINRFRQGKLIPQSPMPWNAFKHMSDDELKAVYNFLKTVPAAATEVEK